MSLMFLALLPMKSLFQIARRHSTRRIFTTNEVNIVKNLLTSAILVLESHNETYSVGSASPNIHLEKGQGEQQIHLTHTTKTS